jgi:hypothetical protein
MYLSIYTALYYLPITIVKLKSEDFFLEGEEVIICKMFKNAILLLLTNIKYDQIIPL